METIQNTNENSLGSSRRFESPQEELLNYQFKYIEKLINGELKPLIEKEPDHEENFEESIFVHTDFREYLTNEYSKKTGKNVFSNTEEERKNFEKWVDSVMDKIVENRNLDSKNYLDNLFNVIKSKLEELESESVKKDIILKNEENEERAGLINFNEITIGDQYVLFDLKRGDPCISIHFKDLVDQKSKDDSVNNIFSNESLSNLAVQIIEKYPEAKAVIGHSWLVSSPVGKRIGFTVSKEHKEVTSSSCFWGQFVNDKGWVKKEMIEEFLKTGIPKYLVSDGFIKIEDFLKRYLPKEKKGIIKLKEISPESKSFREEINKIVEKVRDSWTVLSFDEIFSLIDSNPFLANFYKTEDGKKHKKMLMEFKKSGLSSDSSMDDFVYDNKEDINNKFRKYLESYKYNYVEKEVFIGDN